MPYNTYRHSNSAERRYILGDKELTGKGIIVIL